MFITSLLRDVGLLWEHVVGGRRLLSKNLLVGWGESWKQEGHTSSDYETAISPKVE